MAQYTGMGATLEELLRGAHDTARVNREPPRRLFERLQLISRMIHADSSAVTGRRLLWRNEQGDVVALAVDKERVIGRGSEVDLRLASPRISRRHCVVSPHAAGAEVEDLRSSNGTFVNGTRVQNCLLHDGDTIEVGGIAVVYAE